MGLFKARMGGPWGSLSSGWHSRQGWSLGSLLAQTFLWFSDIHMCPCMIQYLLLFKLKSERTASSRESRCIYRFTDVSLSWQMLGLSEMSSLFCLGFFFFLSHRVSWRWSHSQRWLQDMEITSKLCWTFALCLYQVFCSTVCFVHTSVSGDTQNKTLWSPFCPLVIEITVIPYSRRAAAQV